MYRVSGSHSYDRWGLAVYGVNGNAYLQPPDNYTLGTWIYQTASYTIPSWTQCPCTVMLYVQFITAPGDVDDARFDDGSISFGASAGGSPRFYVYDRFGNRWQQNGPYTFAASFTGNATTNNNRIDLFSYDTAGNLLSDGTHQYFYDAENRLIQVDGTPGTCASGSTTGTTACYYYDADGHRVFRTGFTHDTCDGTGKRGYVYDLAGRWLSEVNGSNGTGCTDELYAGGRHLASAGGDIVYDHTDWLGTSRLRMSSALANGYIIVDGTCTSLPFGDGLSCSGGSQSTLHFTGKERDSESGLDNFGARYNSSQYGRFMSPDEPSVDQHSGDPQSWNLYSYARNNPLNNDDPTGNACVSVNGGPYQDDDSGGQSCADSTKPQEFHVTLSDQERAEMILYWSYQLATDGSAVTNGARAGAEMYQGIKLLGEIPSLWSAGRSILWRLFATADEIGAARVANVAELVGGTTTEGQEITAAGVGTTDVDVVGPSGEMIQVGGPAKAANLSKTGQKLNILKRVADAKGVKAMAYFEKGTPQSVIDVAKRQLGENNVVVFEKAYK